MEDQDQHHKVIKELIPSLSKAEDILKTATRHVIRIEVFRREPTPFGSPCGRTKEMINPAQGTAFTTLPYNMSSKWLL